MSVSELTGVQLVVFFCSSVPVMLFDHSGISKGLIFALLQAVSMIYLLPVMIHGWVRRPPHGLKKYILLPLWKLRARVGLCLFRFVSFLFLLGSGKGCGL